jgi:hypothetical protein
VLDRHALTDAAILVARLAEDDARRRFGGGMVARAGRQYEKEREE